MIITPVATTSAKGKEILAGLRDRFQLADPACQQAVTTIIADIRQRGDEALLEYIRKFDAPEMTASQLRVSDEELHEAMASADEEDAVRGLIGLMKIKPCVVLGFSLDKAAAIIYQSSIFIGNNSGLLHIAAALGRPTVSTMGPTVPWLWRPQGDNQKVIRHSLECSPCNRGVCLEHKCMELITVEEMEGAVDDLFKK